MNLSNRIEAMQFSPIRKLVPFAEEAKKRGVSVYHLNIGQPDINTPEAFMEGINQYTDKVLKYANSQGISSLIESFIKYYKEWDIEFEKDEIMVTNGGSEAILFALMAICDQGDEIIVPEPFYTNYTGFTDVASVKIVPFITKAEDGFHLPPKEEITSKITSKTKAIMVSNPGNPTGVVYTEAEVRMLADIANENDLFLIADEVYREFVYDGLKYTSALYMKDVQDKVILIDSISKRYSACGARIGLVASKNKSLMNQIIKLGQTRLCVPTIEQLAAANLINTPKSYFIEVKKEYEERRNILYEYLSKIPGVICIKPTGAFYVIAKLPIESGEDFAKWLLTDFNYNNKTVMVAPAEGFYSTKGLGVNEIRLSYCLNTTALKDSMEILGIALKKYLESNK
ncbi:pyridoxal phosphate-dependent aminotransferase [Clostridium bowmanii]|uniref:pyridoxal phosphate-dependent aminotransferase n=1 Tax=Clostridium bowmanii TaxID=132925 RepID=UPI001C0BB02F|nr:pyridoxal phosphate-dependent aminotransferase [Clostridium bowmanii]MBU3189302.1 pyridoxal phosphate-dependent aminotransferase [Clostridium bowmanii]MCA1073185.1 pyridoxal phosphate-dependent aminotransferase [Clostridium bowmanii]